MISFGIYARGNIAVKKWKIIKPDRQQSFFFRMRAERTSGDKKRKISGMKEKISVHCSILV